MSMDIPSLVARRNKNIPLIISVLFLGYSLFWFAQTKKPAFAWLPLNDIGKLFFIIGMSFALYLILKTFSSKPEIVVDNIGIQRRKIFFLKIETIEWANIYYYYFIDEKNFDKTIKSLAIKLKEPQKEIQINLKGLDKSIAEIAEAIAPFENKYGFLKLP
jgi:hypothetical protein